MTVWPWVALGSALGGSLRYLLGLLSLRAFPFDTLFINTSGCLLIGLAAALVVPTGGRHLPPCTRPLVMTGFCGGYTSFSLFSLESLRLLALAPAAGLLNLILTLAACLLAVWWGHRLGSHLKRSLR